MDLQLQDKRAIVIGGSRGIGRAIANTLVEEGTRVAICARSAEGVADAVAQLNDQADGERALGSALNVAKHADIPAWVAQMVGELGGLDIVVANPSAMPVGHNEAAWRKAFELDMLGTVAVAEATAAHLEAAATASGDAAFIAISSISASSTANGASAYGGIKAALIHYISGLAREWAPKKVRANTVSPGTVYFPGGVWNMIEDNMPELYQNAIARNPTGRMATDREIADTTVFLASPRSSFTTGANFIVDGSYLEGVGI